MQLINIDPQMLAVNPWNTNRVNADNQAKLNASMKDVGLFKPVICRTLENGTLEILAGEHRTAIAVQNGLQEIPVINLGTIDDEKAKKIMLADNARYGSDDTLALAELLKGMDSGTVLADILPWTQDDLDNVMSSVNIDLDILEEFDENEEIETEIPEKTEKPLKTHEVMRFKFTLGDAGRVRAALDRIKREQGFTEEDDLTNAGDAIVWHLFNGNKNEDE